MAGSIVSVLSAILKDDYMPPTVEQLNQEVLITNLLGVNSKDIVGNNAVMALHTGRSPGIGARRELEDLPDAGYQTYARITYDLKYLYARVQVTGQVMQKTKNGQGSFVVDVLKDEMTRIKDDLANDLSRQFYGDGTGAIATCGTTTTSTTVNLLSTESLVKGYLYVNLPIDIGTVANPIVVAQNRIIQSVSLSGNGSIVISGATVSTTSGTHFVFLYNNADATGNKEIDNGLQKLIPTAANTVGGINGATATYWDVQRTSLSSGILTYDSMLQMKNKLRQQGANTSALVTSFGIQRQYFNILQSQARYQEPTKLDGGWETLTFEGTPFFADRHAPFGMMFWIDGRYIQPFADGDWRFLEEDGEVIKWVQNKDAWQAALARYMQLGINRRNVQGLIYSIADTAGI